MLVLISKIDIRISPRDRTAVCCVKRLESTVEQCQVAVMWWVVLVKSNRVVSNEGE